MKQFTARWLTTALALGICALGPGAFADDGSGGGGTTAPATPCVTVTTQINPSVFTHLPTPSSYFTVKTNVTNCSSQPVTLQLLYSWSQLSGSPTFSTYSWTPLSGSPTFTNFVLYGTPAFTLKPGETRGFNDTEFEFPYAGVYQVINPIINQADGSFLASSSATLTISPQ